jgi:hypothetical protein
LWLWPPMTKSSTPLVLVLLALVPIAHADVEDDWRPVLNARLTTDGVKLEWTTPDGPRGLEIQQAEIWRHVPLGPGVGTWELYETRNGVAPYFVDEDGTNGTFYCVRLVFKDGEVSPPSNPSSVDYPHCSWLVVTVPPKVSQHCLFPPPFVQEGLLAS